MQLTESQTLIMIIAVASGAMITRFLPFIIFPDKKETPEIVNYLGKVLPPAMMGLLVVYCIRNINISKAPFAFPEFISIALIVILHKWKNNVLLSIGGGTAMYILIINYLI